MSAQPERQPFDGPVSLARGTTTDGEPVIYITCETSGQSKSISVGEHNAWRLFAMLAMVLDIKLPAALLRGIKL